MLPDEQQGQKHDPQPLSSKQSYHYKLTGAEGLTDRSNLQYNHSNRHIWYIPVRLHAALWQFMSSATGVTRSQYALKLQCLQHCSSAILFGNQCTLEVTAFRDIGPHLEKSDTNRTSG